MNKEERKRFKERIFEPYKKIMPKKPIKELMLRESALIYWYSAEGYEEINSKLREGKKHPYETMLNHALLKLPAFDGVVYRGVNMYKKDLQRYIDAFNNRGGEIITEPAFTSTSENKSIAKGFYKSDIPIRVLFKIFSKKGRIITNISKMSDEKEVLFCSKSQFKVLNITEKEGIHEITMEEI
jgi:hypothetical protein